MSTQSKPMLNKYYVGQTSILFCFHQYQILFFCFISIRSTKIPKITNKLIHLKNYMQIKTNMFVMVNETGPMSIQV